MQRFEHSLRRTGQGRGRYNHGGRGRTGRGRRDRPYHGGRGDQMKPLLDMIISDLHPHTIVEEPGFLRFFESISQSPPTSPAMLSELQSLISQMKRIVQERLEREDNVALSSEVWNTTTNKTYMTTTCHLIDDTWTRQAYVLETKSLPEEYKASHVVGQLRKIADTWRLGNKIKVVVTNVDGMKKDIKKAGWDLIPCFANTLDVVFKETLEASSDWKEVVQRCYEISEYFSHAEAQGQLKRAQIKMGFKQHNLVESKGDQWLSTLNMLVRISEQHQAVREVLLEFKCDLLLSEHELKNIMKTTSCLEAFKHVTSPAERYYSLSNIIPQVESIKKKLLDLQRGGNEFAKELAQHLNHHFSKAKENDWLTLSATLDPRHRDIALSEKGASARIQKTIIAEMKHLAEERSFIQPDSLHKDLRRYLEKKRLPIDWDPLAFWNFQKGEDWNLSEVARKYLAVVLTAGPADIAFDTEKARLVASRRSNLDPEHLNMMLFLNGNRFLLS
ncbi:zinc finger BED domain-containing protein 6 isoform X2 [Pimephales promelas]|uniref:zinc finger BED domain-containing protein 6 isoform X2 n=1 Tax=Pimephales promelas TaxID=90988 RepID=UPI00195595AE|nr:zinc finger BED domain-containing protein 6 isoform X2 [Pimephales promelas]